MHRRRRNHSPHLQLCVVNLSIAGLLDLRRGLEDFARCLAFGSLIKTFKALPSWFISTTSCLKRLRPVRKSLSPASLLFDLFLIRHKSPLYMLGFAFKVLLPARSELAVALPADTSFDSTLDRSRELLGFKHRIDSKELWIVFARPELQNQRLLLQEPFREEVIDVVEA